MAKNRPTNVLASPMKALGKISSVASLPNGIVLLMQDGRMLANIERRYSLVRREGCL